MKVEVDVASVGDKDSFADVGKTLFFEFGKFLEEAGLEKGKWLKLDYSLNEC